MTDGSHRHLERSGMETIIFVNYIPIQSSFEATFFLGEVSSLLLLFSLFGR